MDQPKRVKPLSQEDMVDSDNRFRRQTHSEENRILREIVEFDDDYWENEEDVSEE